MLSPVKRRAEHLLEETGHLSRLREPARRLLAEDELAVERDLEAAAASALELDRAKDGRPAAQELVSQAHGPV